MGIVVAICRKLASAAVLGCIAPLALAVPVFTQDPLDGSDGPNSNPSLGFENADNFLLESATDVTGFRWWGSFFFDAVTTPDTDLFTLRVYGDDGTGSLPDQDLVLFDSTFGPDDIERTDSGLVDVVGEAIYQFDVALTSPLALAADTAYYLSVVYLFDDIDADFYWAMSDGGGNFFRDNPDDDGIGFLVDDLFIGNLAFEVLGDAGQPMPVATPANLGVLLALALFARRARRLR